MINKIMVKIKAVIIGVGNMGKNHLRTYLGIDSVSLLAIADLNKEEGQKLASNSSVKYYEDYKKMVLDEKPQLVSICVPTSFHYEVAKFCMENGCHVLLEKPISMNYQHGVDLIGLAKERNIKFLVGHIERFNPAVKKVKEIIEKREIGEITSIVCRRVGGFPPQIKDADIAIDLAIHDIDIVNYMIEDIPEKVFVNKKSNHIEKRADSVEFFLLYKKASAYIQANWITPVKIRSLSITGTEGYLEMDYITQKIQFYKSNYEKFRQEFADFSDYVMRFSEPDVITISVAKKEPLKEEMLYFIDCILNNTDVNADFALKALKIAIT